MKITIYELLGLIKDGKAPKKFKYDSYVWTYNFDRFAYFNGEGIEFEDHMDYSLMNYIDDEVEILEEEKEIPEKIPEEIIVGKKQPVHRIKKIEKKINEIINYLDYLKSKGE